ncbi:MAG: putative Ig domain-containing protein, partial [Acholeplasmataceae bacterium]|nr:putative Ig domain-containing protein [Acholeplasmataceae bacterium]
FLDDPGHYGYHKNIKGAIWMGYPGKTGIMALGRILNGEVNPSGKTVDTWARDFKMDPTWQNFSDNLVPSGNQYSNISSRYVIYKEGIYSGYRYYETRGFTEGNASYLTDGTANAPHINGTTTTQWNDWYEAHVVYPFGHGLSYTTFSQEIVKTSLVDGSFITDSDVITMNVKVTNTGDVAGKEIVQLFYTAPYNPSGSETAIEKSSVVLGGFTKTKLLEPGESETVSVSLIVRDMASYDFDDANNNGFKGYELEAGDYEIKIMKNAHTVIESVTYQVASPGIKCLNDGTTGNPVVNQFDDVSNYLTNSVENGGQNEKYMSRSDFAGTFPTMALRISATPELIAEINAWTPGNKPSDEGKPWYVPEDQMPAPYGNDQGDVMYSDLIGAAHNDPLWDTFLNQLSFNTMKNLVGNGSYTSGINLPQLGITKVINAGQPAGYMSLFKGMEGQIYAFFSSDVVTASTYNEELAYRKGIALGNEALFGTGIDKSRFPGWYAPAVNTHRSPFGGRNADYFSEDGLIGGKMASQIIKGAMEKGVFTFLKHFAVNDQEADRVRILTWANEQSMREIYFKPFEISVKEGKTTGIMSALNRLGPTWVGGHYGLLTNVLRKEWGFVGTVVTDSFIGSYSYVDQMIRAGGDLSLGNSLNDSGWINEIDSATTRTALRNAVHNILYTQVNSMAMNTGYAAPPAAIKEYIGGSLPFGLVSGSYIANLGTATINPDAFIESGVVPDDSEIKYSVKEGSQLPAGLTLSENGMLTGTPTEELNSHSFVVEASYGKYVIEASFMISIVNLGGSIIYQMDPNLDSAIIGEDYQVSVASAEIYKHGATPEEIENFPEVYYTLKNASQLPEGLTLSADGTISGTPLKEAVNYPFTVVASALGFKDSELTFYLNVYMDLVFTGKTLLTGKIGNAYIDKVELVNSSQPVTYSLKDPLSLPEGLTLTESGTIVGTPIKAVTEATFIVIASAAYSEPVEAEYKITIGLAFNEISLPYGKENQAYYTKVDVAQGAAVTTYSLKEGSSLPEGLTLNENGTISGTPTTAGVYTFTVIANAEGYQSDERELTLYVANADVVEAPTKTNYTGIIVISVVSATLVIGIITGAVIIKKRK